MREIARDPSIIVFSAEPLDQPQDDLEVDVQVNDAAGRWGATFVTLNHIARTMVLDRFSGEQASGRYFWVADMVVVRRVSDEIVRATVADLIAEQQLHRVFAALDDA